MHINVLYGYICLFACMYNGESITVVLGRFILYNRMDIFLKLVSEAVFSVHLLYT